MRWEPGRQGGGYQKMKLWSFWKLDGYLIKYPPYSRVTPHRDTVPGKRHYRFNIELRRPALGGMYRCSYRNQRVCGVKRAGRLVLFRPDTTTHSVRVFDEPRLVLSLGLAV